MNGRSFSFYYTYSCMLYVPYDFAQLAIDYTKAGLFYPNSLSLSSNFSQILGTAKKTVGLAQ